MAKTTGKRTTVLHFAILTYREEVAPGRFTWFARSINTSDLALGASEKEAIAGLGDTLAVSVQSALKRGASLKDWYAAQVPDDPRWFDTFLSLWAPPKGRIVKMHPSQECEIEARVVRNEAA